MVKDGKTPKAEVTGNNDGTHYTVKVTDGDGNVTNAIIKDGSKMVKLHSNNH